MYTSCHVSGMLEAFWRIVWIYFQGFVISDRLHSRLLCCLGLHFLMLLRFMLFGQDHDDWLGNSFIYFFEYQSSLHLIWKLMSAWWMFPSTHRVSSAMWLPVIACKQSCLFPGLQTFPRRLPHITRMVLIRRSRQRAGPRPGWYRSHACWTSSPPRPHGDHVIIVVDRHIR